MISMLLLQTKSMLLIITRGYLIPLLREEFGSILSSISETSTTAYTEGVPIALLKVLQCLQCAS
jgi:hypothetical protein